MKTQQKTNIYLLGVLVIVLAVTGPWFNSAIFDYAAFKSYVAGIGIGVLMLITLWKVHSNSNKAVLNLSWLKISWFSLLVFGALSILWSVHAEFSIAKWMDWFLVFCAFIVGYHLQLEKKILTKLCWILLICALIIALIGIAQYLFNFSGIPQATFASSTFGNKNMATQPIVLVLPLSLFLLFSNDVKSLKVWFLTISIALIILFVFYTRTRSSWLSIFGEILLIAGFLLMKYRAKTIGEWINWNKTKTKASIFALALFLILINFNSEGLSFFTDITGRVAETTKESGTSGRLGIWGAAFDMIKVSPFFGTGLGTWTYNNIQGGFGTFENSNIINVHNDVLELGIDLGVIGMIMLLIGVVLINFAIFKIINNDSKRYALFYYLMWVAMAGSFVQMQFSFPYQLGVPLLLFGLYLGLISQRSELFIPAIKTIQIRSVKNYQLAIKVIAVGMVTGVIIVYANWIAVSNEIDDMAKNHQFYKMKNIDYIIKDPNIIPLVNRLSDAYLKKGKFSSNIFFINEYLLKHFPDYNVSLWRYASSISHKKKRQKDALKALSKINIKGFYEIKLILEAKIHLAMGEREKFRQKFDEIVTYEYKQNIKSWIISHYKYYKQYNCLVEQRMARLLVEQGKYQEAQKHIDIIKNSENSECLDLELAKTLQEKGA